jgi:hypothetical protein
MSTSLPPLDPPPRKAHLRRALQNVRRGYRTIFALFILVLGGWAGLDAFRWYALKYRTQLAEGVVLKKYTVNRAAGGEARLEYEFKTADGTSILHDGPLSHPMYEKAAEGQAIAVVYLPENPRVDHWLFDNEDVRSNVLYLTIGHAFATLLALAVWRLVERPLQRELQLARFGVVTEGRVESISKPRGRRRIVRVIYSFQAPTGQTIKGRCKLGRQVSLEAIAPGVAIEVLVDPKNARLHRPRLAFERVEFGEAPKKKT